MVDIPELFLSAISLEHERTGAQHIHLARDDKNNTFRSVKYCLCFVFSTTRSTLFCFQDFFYHQIFFVSKIFSTTRYTLVIEKILKVEQIYFVPLSIFFYHQIFFVLFSRFFLPPDLLCPAFKIFSTTRSTLVIEKILKVEQIYFVLLSRFFQLADKPF